MSNEEPCISSINVTEAPESTHGGPSYNLAIHLKSTTGKIIEPSTQLLDGLARVLMAYGLTHEELAIEHVSHATSGAISAKLDEMVVSLRDVHGIIPSSPARQIDPTLSDSLGHNLQHLARVAASIKTNLGRRK